MDIKEYLENTHISKWDISNVTDMGGMFFNNIYFNQDISKWDVSNIIDTNSMFDEAISFNQDISRWDISNVTDMRWMFFNNISFNQDLSPWGDKLHKDVKVYEMFEGSGLEGNEPQWYLDKINKG